MLYDIFDSKIDDHTHSAREIDQRARTREGQRWFLQAEYSPRKNETRKSVRKGLVALLTGLFGLAL